MQALKRNLRSTEKLLSPLQNLLDALAKKLRFPEKLCDLSFLKTIISTTVLLVLLLSLLIVLVLVVLVFVLFLLWYHIKKQRQVSLLARLLVKPALVGPSSRGAGSTRPRADALLVHGRDRNYSLGSGCKYP